MEITLLTIPFLLAHNTHTRWNTQASKRTAHVQAHGHMIATARTRTDTHAHAHALILTHTYATHAHTFLGLSLAISLSFLDPSRLFLQVKEAMSMTKQGPFILGWALVDMNFEDSLGQTCYHGSRVSSTSFTRTRILRQIFSVPRTFNIELPSQRFWALQNCFFLFHELATQPRSNAGKRANEPI